MCHMVYVVQAEVRLQEACVAIAAAHGKHSVCACGTGLHTSDFSQAHFHIKTAQLLNCQRVGWLTVIQVQGGFLHTSMCLPSA